MMQLTAEFQWGVVFFSDEFASEDPPDFSSHEALVTTSEDTIVMAVLEDIQGEVSVFCWQDEPEISGIFAYSGEINAKSGRLVISDALGNENASVHVASGTHRVRIFFNDLTEATRVDIVLD